ncbi:MAG: ABC transporter substrate-binding protein [Burkholderiales bacterium]|nr:ABC transporter substrate-binding protein [Burkholderiales bacterium]
MQRRQLITQLIAAGAAAFATLPTRAWALEDRRVRFGQSASLSGAQAHYGRDVQAGVAAALAAANRQEGPRGLQFELQTLDDGGVRDRCVANTRQLIEGGVIGLLGLTSGAAAEACLGLVQQHQIAMIGTASGNMGIRGKAAEHAVHVRAGYDVEYRRIVGYIKSYGFQRVGYVYLQDTSQANLAAMTDALNAVGLKPTVAIGIDRNASAQVEVTRQLMAAKVEAVMFTTNAGPALAILEQLNRAQFRGMVFASSFAGQDLIDGVARAGRSVVMSLVVPRPGALGTGVVGQCQRDLATAGKGATLGVTTLEGYIAGRVAVEAARLAAQGGAVSRQRLRDALGRLNTDLGGYRVAYTPHSREGSQHVDLVVIDRFGRLAG